MKYIANPVEVDAFVIKEVELPAEVSLVRHESGSTWVGGNTEIVIEDGRIIELGPEMTARYLPVAGDYYVVQADGYAYVNPKDVFERKYRIASIESRHPDDVINEQTPGATLGDTSSPDNPAGA